MISRTLVATLIWLCGSPALNGAETLERAKAR
jgi:hypothetical protein